MKRSILSVIVVAGAAVAVPAPQGAPSPKAEDPWKDWDALVGNIDQTVPQIMSEAKPGTDPFLSVTPIVANLGDGKGIAKLVSTVLNKGYGKVPDPAGAAPRRMMMEARNKKIAGSETVKIRYGPYKVPKASQKHLTGHGGTLYNFPDVAVDKPCEGDCMIVGINAGLEFPDGKNANIDNGLWLHHMVLVAEGPNRFDATCVGNADSLPHLLVGTNSNSSERIFASGNERTAALTGDWNVPNGGIKFVDEDKLHLIVDLMNTGEQEEIAYFTLTYDIVKGHPKDIDEIKVVWLDIAQCGTSEVVPLAQKGKFVINAATWKPTFSGTVMAAAGHLHDGGTNVELVVDGKVVCDSKATYGGKPEFIGKDHHGGQTKHISDMTLCLQDESFGGLKEINPDQKWELKAHYDYDVFNGMTHDEGKQDNIMGIAILFARLKK